MSFRQAKSLNQRAHGFSLIELMIVVVIIGIIAAFAYPNYTEQVRKTRRSDAKVALTQVANQLEKFYARCLGYTTTLVGGSINNCADGLGYVSSNSPESYYNITVAFGHTGSITTSYALTATAQNQQSDDAKCPTLTLDSRGIKGPAGSICWN